jgi:hypothetical protein
MSSQRVTSSTATLAAWRTEPEISPERQRYLNELLATSGGTTESGAPFQDERLTRADVEWLLQHAEDMLAAELTSPPQRQYVLDLRGAYLVVHSLDTQYFDGEGILLAAM